MLKFSPSRYRLKVVQTCISGGEDAEVYRNRKSFFSINCQVTCNADLKFINVVASWPGSAHDSTIFNNSNLKIRFDQGEFQNCLLLGRFILEYMFTLIFFLYRVYNILFKIFLL